MSPDAISPWVVGGADSTGLTLIAAHLGSLVAVALLALVAVSVGRGVLNLVGGPADESNDFDSADETVGAFVVGLGVLATILLALSALGVASRVGVLAFTGSLLILRARELGSSARAVIRAVRAPFSSLPGRATRMVATAIAAGVAALTLPRALLPAADWDSLMYHLPIPLAVLEAGRLVVPPDNLHAAYSGLPHLLYTPFLALGLPAGVHLLGLVIAGALALSVWSAAARRGGGAAGLGALLALVGSTPLLLVAVTPRVDVTLAAWMWIGHAALLRILFDGWTRRRAAHVILILGFGIGVKYHAFAYGVTLVPLAVAAAVRGAASAKVAVRRVGILGGGAAAVGLPWLLKNAVLFGSPLYPFGAERVVPGWLADLLGSAAHPESVGLDVYWILREARAPFDLITFLTDPARVSVEGEAAFFILSPLLVLLFAGVAGPRPSSGSGRWAGAAVMGPALGFAVLILAVSSRTNPRYLLPALPGLAVAAGWGLGEALRRIPEGRRRGLAGTLLVLGVMPPAMIAATALDPVHPLRHLVGVESPRASLEHRGLGGLLRLGGRLEELAGRDSGSRSVLVADARGLYLGARVIQDNVLTNWPLLTAAPQLETCLAGTGIDRIVVARGSLDFYRARGMTLTPLRLDEMEAFLLRCGSAREEVGPWEIVSLRR